MMSLYWRLEEGMAVAMGLSLVVGVALVETLQSFGYHEVGLKWPNDVYAQGAKLPGSGRDVGDVGRQLPRGDRCGAESEHAVATLAGHHQPWTALSAIASTPVARNRLQAK